MFKRKTVFIVGAGASKEVGLPVGDELKTAITGKLNIRFDDGYSQNSGDKKIVEALRLIVNERGGRDINPLCQSGRIIASAMPQAISIDNFLHTHANDADIVLMGKLGIAASILEAERSSKIRAKEGVMDFGAHPHIWHNTFCKMLAEGVQLGELETIFDNVAFVTFNYDRCIEHFVSHWLENYFRISADHAQNLTRKLKVFHPYGQVGRLPWQGGGISVAYGAELSSRTLPQIAGQIRTFTERVDDDAMLEEMRGYLALAEQVIYLGFSYGQMNMELLTIPACSVYKRLFGTTFRMSPANVQAVQARVEQSFTVNSTRWTGHQDFVSAEANQILNDYWYHIV
ncbi:hypothetical protein GFL93_09250 [Rhizobium leguminosarum bv. viciae]|uniref:hypothetical protein n=1 Tax=Rhizobium TaxID=379 RepID=UPI001441CC71|nr:hypothetical protein [Rhizobium leguminosarum]NKK06056.1 hypothetical protein [Rhizobium leguminosarum bv. viciae]